MCLLVVYSAYCFVTLTDLGLPFELEGILFQGSQVLGLTDLCRKPGLSFGFCVCGEQRLLLFSPVLFFPMLLAETRSHWAQWLDWPSYIPWDTRVASSFLRVFGILLVLIFVWQALTGPFSQQGHLGKAVLFCHLPVNVTDLFKTIFH